MHIVIYEKDRELIKETGRNFIIAESSNTTARLLSSNLIMRRIKVIQKVLQKLPRIHYLRPETIHPHKCLFSPTMNVVKIQMAALTPNSNGLV